MQQALLDVLELRGFALTAEARARIDACEQFETLERWYAIARTGDPNTPIIDLLG